MNRGTCQAIEPLLVEYLDGDLDESDSQRVARHIDQCRDCRTYVFLLQRSLAIAKRQWEEAASGTPGITVRPSQRRRPKRLTVAVGASCVAVVMLGVAIVAIDQTGRLVHRNGSDSEPREGEAPAEPSFPAVSARREPTTTVSGSDAHEPDVARNQSLMPANEAPKQPDIDAMILREVQAARLAASARLLASQPGLEEFSDQAASYLSSTYGDRQSSAELAPTLRNNGS